MYVLLSLTGLITNLSRVVIYKIRALPQVVTALRASDPTTRAAAAATISAHWHEVLLSTTLPARRDERDLVELSIDELTARVARVDGRADWRRIGCWWLAAWTVGLAAVLVAVITHEPSQ